jgi:hypothetical protein
VFIRDSPVDVGLCRLTRYIAPTRGGSAVTLRQPRTLVPRFRRVPDRGSGGRQHAACPGLVGAAGVGELDAAGGAVQELDAELTVGGMTALVYAAVRTPFGRFNGALADVRPDDLAAGVIGSLLSRTPALGPAAVDVGQGPAVVLENPGAAE